MEKVGDILGSFFLGSSGVFLVLCFEGPHLMENSGGITAMFGVGSIFAAGTAWWIDFKKKL